MGQPSTNLNTVFETAIRSNWELTSLSDYGGETFTYRDVGRRIIRIHHLLRLAGVKKGNAVALVGKNSASWGIIYLATVTYGAVIVPILPDFKPADIHSIVTHSDSVLLFVEESIFKELDFKEMPLLKRVLRIKDLSLLAERESTDAHSTEAEQSAGKTGTGSDGKAGAGIEPGSESMDGNGGKQSEFLNETGSVGETIGPDDLSFPVSHADDIAVISYTSGTTGFSKGVVLPHKSLLGNIRYAQQNMPLNARDKILSFLPLAHTYGCAFEFLFPFTLGCDITFLTKTPSPKIIMQAFQEIKPALILSVPLVIEKIYKSQLIPAIRKPAIQALIRIPFINKLIYRKIREKMVAVFGGNFRELVIGGAPFNAEAEKFFRKMNFPFTVGYGMTECGPLISYASWKTTELGASGRVVDELEVRIDSDDPQHKSGEILLRGNHVMLGYYKNEEATKAVLEPSGWLHTGDLGVIDKKGNIYIKGRSKSMILGPSGKNIYPEEIESVLNNRFMVMESLVIDRDGKLVALIFPDFDAVEKAGHKPEALPEIFKGYIHDLNHRMPKYITIADFEIVPGEFEKTPKRSIKRFLYR